MEHPSDPKLSFKQRCHHFKNSLLSRPQEFHAFLVNAWVIHFGSRAVPLSPKPAIVFSPHQDDETLGCGGIIALKRQQSVPVQVVFMTDGQKSHMYAPWLESPPDIVQIRRQEAIDALTVLGVKPADTHFLDQMDGALGELSQTQRQSVIQKIVHLLLMYRPEEVYVPHRKDNHPDHRATYELVRSAIAAAQLEVELLQYPIWLFWESLIFFGLRPRDLQNAVRLTIGSVRQQKQRAIAAYRSQQLLLPPGFLKGYRTPYEIFFKE